MPTSNLYPAPPHLTIAIYSAGSESECFAAICESITQVDCHPNGTVEVAPWEATFELRSDLAGQSSILDVDRERFTQLVAGQDASMRPIRAGYRVRSDVVVVEYLASSGGDRHPIGISTGAGALGIPVEMWQKNERKSAGKLARWAIDVLQLVVTQCDPIYGAIGVEYSLATPHELASRNATLPSEVYLSRGLASDASIRDAFGNDFRGAEVAEWLAGWFYSGWEPFNSSGTTLPQSQIHPTRASAILGRALSRD